MQTVAKLSERLDMSAEEAIEKLRHMLFEVDGIQSTISDEECDVLIDVDEDPSLADKVRVNKLEEIESQKQAKAKIAAKKKAAAAKKKATAAKKKAAPAKKKTAAKKKPAAKKKAAVLDAPEAGVAKSSKAKGAEAPHTLVAAKPVAEILSDADVAAMERAEAARHAAAAAHGVGGDASAVVEEVPSEPTIVIGSAIEHDEHKAEIVRADGTHIDASAVEISDDTTVDDEGSELGLLAKAERQQQADDERKAKDLDRPVPTATPDPDVVADVIRKASARKEEAGSGRSRKKTKAGQSTQGVPERRPRQRPPQAGTRKTGKTARKRQKKLERMREEETLRRSAAAAIKEYQSGAMDGAPKKRKKKKIRADGLEGIEVEETIIINVEESMTVEELAQAMEIDATDLIIELMEESVMVTKNHSLSFDLIRQLAEPKGYEVRAVIPEEEVVMAEEEGDPANRLPRAPVITVMGHVDHGKTSLLDQVRKASVASGEAGGITQHIAAYEVSLPQGRVVFLDTPGHEAFTAMRARGAQVTDVVVLVVAADDGIMPQTIEAIDHARAAGVPIVVAVNKCDKPDAQPDRIRQELVKYDLTDEQWGGKTIIKNISALSGDGIDELMELLVLETELLELTADPSLRARGTIVESELTRGQGPVAWVLVQSGTLRVGDVFVAGSSYGRVRSLQDSGGRTVQEAGPSTPVVVTGFSSTATAGDMFIALKDERIARTIAEKRAHHTKLREGAQVQHVTLEDFHERLLAGEKQELNVVVKGDVQGSIDVLGSSLDGVGNEEVSVNIVHSGVGAINESDVLLASASDAVILGFHVTMSPRAEKLAQSEGVDVRTYTVIYEMIQDVHNSLEGLLAPEQREVLLGHAEIRQIFKSSALGNIAGCIQLDGETRRDSKARVLRGDETVYEGRVDSLRRDKDTVSDVQTGFECGIKLQGFDDIQEGDIIEAYMIEEVAKTLS